MLNDKERLHQAIVYGRAPDSWAGWRFTESGRYLVTPDGTRLSPERIRGIAWRFEMESRRDAARNRAQKRVRQEVVTVLRIPNRDWHRERFGCSAG